MFYHDYTTDILYLSIFKCKNKFIFDLDTSNFKFQHGLSGHQEYLLVKSQQKWNQL